MKRIKLSFILPCHNVEKYVGTCLDSLFQQDISADEYEVICVNDCSADNTKDIVLAYQNEHPTIKLIDLQEKKTSGESRNIGMDAAVGEYIWFVDADDMIKTNVIKGLLHVCKQNNLDELLFNFNMINELGNEIDVKYLFGDSEVMDGISFVNTYFNNRLSELSIIWRQIYRTNYIKKNQIRFPNINMGEDGPFAWRSLLLGTRVQTLSDSFYIYRKNNSSMTTLFEQNPLPDKLFDKSILFGSEVHKLSKELESVNSEIAKDLDNISLWSLNIFTKTVINYSNKNKNDFYLLCVRNKVIIKQLKSYFSRWNRILLTSAINSYFLWKLSLFFLKIKTISEL